MTKTKLIWAFAIVLTLTAAVYQRYTGPTYPARTTVFIDQQKVKLDLKRSHPGEKDCPIVLPIADENVKGKLEYRIYPTKGEFTVVDMVREGANLKASLPHQEVAGKLEYRVILQKNSQPIPVNDGKSVVIRFRGDVPAVIIIPHILIMFLAMLLSNMAGLFALFQISTKKMVNYTLLTLFAGGLILGPLVQKYAFNELWAGVPYGWDLTDNKTLIAFVVWVIAAMLQPKGENRWGIVAASLVTIAIFSIPHSLFGSQLDPETGKIIQGIIYPILW